MNASSGISARRRGPVPGSSGGRAWRRAREGWGARAERMIVAEGLRKSFGNVHALDGVDLDVQPSTVLGLLGPNGAGKTTVVRILTTLLHPDAGHATVAGHDVLRAPGG